MGKAYHHTSATIEVEVEFTAEGIWCAGFKGSRLEPPEPAGYELNGYTIHAKGIRDQIKGALDDYIHNHWDDIDKQMTEADQAAYEDYCYEQYRDRQLERSWCADNE